MDKTVLIVDDSELNREILKEILHSEYRILEAGDGREALDILGREWENMEGIVLDLIMPVMDGYAFLEQYSAHDHWKEIPVLVTTADEGAQVENRCLKLGAWDFVHKPFNPATVHLRLQNNISRRRLYLLEKQRIEDTFGRYVDPSIMKELLREGVSAEELKGRNVQIAVMFADIRGFTALSEQMQPEQVVEILNECLTVTSRSVKKYGGTLDKYMGDCTMAFWGAPLPCEDAVYKACRAAMDLICGARPLADRLFRKFGKKVSYGIGIHTGPAVVGNIGSPDRMDYTAVGDTVNTASRLEAKADSGKIYISGAVASALGARAAMTSLGKNIHLKGKAEGIEILTLDVLY